MKGREYIRFMVNTLLNFTLNTTVKYILLARFRLLGMPWLEKYLYIPQNKLFFARSDVKMERLQICCPLDSKIVQEAGPSSGGSTAPPDCSSNSAADTD